MMVKDEQNLNRAHSEIRILKRIQGRPHLAQIVDSCEDETLSKVYVFEKDAGRETL